MKEFIKSKHFLNLFISAVYSIFGVNFLSPFIKTKWGGVYLWRCKFISKGKCNMINIDETSRLKKCIIYFNGSNNHIQIGKHVYMENVTLWIENDNNSVVIGENSIFAGTAHIACTEGTSIIFGQNCLVSNDVVIRSGDSHSILNRSGERINRAQDISIGNSVWIGNRVIVLKGVSIAPHSVVGTGAVVTSSLEYRDYSVVAGNPARVVKNNVDWIFEKV